MEAIASAHTITLMVLALHIVGLSFVCVLLVRGESESKRVRRQLDARLDRTADHVPSAIEPSAS